MNYYTRFLLLLTFTLFFSNCSAQQSNSRDKVQIFYYGWYANPATDGDYQHWNHEILPHWSNPKWNNLGHH